MTLARAPQLLLLTALLGLLPVQTFALGPGDCFMNMPASTAGVPAQASLAAQQPQQPAGPGSECATSHCCCEPTPASGRNEAAAPPCVCSEPTSPPAEQPPVVRCEIPSVQELALPLRHVIELNVQPQTPRPVDPSLGSSEPPVRTRLGVRLL